MKKHNLSRNPELAQVWTPSVIAKEMVLGALATNSNIKKVLDPACGTAVFSEALSKTSVKNIQLDSYDIDERMVKFTSVRNKALGFNGSTKVNDYLADTTKDNTFDLVIMNPPYIRQELIPSDSKNIYHNYLKEKLGESIDKRSNLFVLFLLKGVVDLRTGGVLCAIVYDAIFQTRYGKNALKILMRHAELLSQKKVEAPFKGVLVDAQILIFKKRARVSNEIETDITPVKAGYIPLGDLLNTRRGTSLPKRAVYTAIKGEPFFDCSIPFLMKQSSLGSLNVKADKKAYLGESLSENNCNKVSKWLKTKAKLSGIDLSKIKVQAVRGNIVFNYYIRNAPRHLWNKNNVAISDNFYVATTKGDFPNEVAWLLLNSDKYLNRLIEGARNQGSGLKKLQLYEYKQVQIPNWNVLTKDEISSLHMVAINLITQDSDYHTIKITANEQVKRLFNA